MNSRKLWLLVSLGILALVIIVIVQLEDTVEIEQAQASHYLPLVSVVNPPPQNNRGIIHAYAELRPRWSTTLKAQVRGEIVEVTHKALAGESVKKGDLLIRIEESHYRANLHEAEQVLSEAILNLLQEKMKADQAKKNLQRSGMNITPSDLALRKPQVELAEKAVTAARSRLHAAKKSHANTRIKAPFSGVIITRHISIGQSVTEGEELLHIVHDRQQDIAVRLSKQQWAMLAENWQDQVAHVRNMTGTEIARARIKRGGGFVDQETRQYMLFLEIVDQSGHQVLPGDFIQVQLPGRIAQNSLVIPESALTRDGFVWYVDDNDRLRRFFARVLFHQDDRIVIETPSNDAIADNYPASWRIATTPLASFLAGNLVRPVILGKI